MGCQFKQAIIASMSKDFPEVVRIEPASQCNLACSHCPTGTVTLNRGLMSEDIFQKIVLELAENQSSIRVVVLYHGGEPLLNKRFFEWASKVRQILPDSRIKTVTNGVTLTERNARSLLSCGLDEVEISIDGLSEEENELVRRKVNSKSLMANVRRLIGLRDQLKNHLKIVISSTQFFDDSHETMSVPTWITNQLPRSVDKYKVHLAMVWPHMEVQDGFSVFQQSGPDSDHCDHINSTVSIRANGDFVPCCYDLTSQHVLGNIAETSIRELWTGNALRQLRTSIKEKNYSKLCSNCNVVRPHRYLIPTWRN